MSWLSIGEGKPSASGKTLVWDVATTDGALLGVVKWHGPWRKYTFHPAYDTLFEEDCLREIAQFAEARTAEHKRPNSFDGTYPVEPGRTAGKRTQGEGV